MNIGWIIPKEGESHRRDVLPQDERELYLNGYTRYQLEVERGGEGMQRASVFIQRPPTTQDFFRAAEGLYGLGGAIRVYDASGKILTP